MFMPVHLTGQTLWKRTNLDGELHPDEAGSVETHREAGCKPGCSWPGGRIATTD